MKRRTIATIGILAAILMTVSGAELAFARGGGGGGSHNGKGSGTNASAGTSQRGNTNHYQYKQQHQYQYRQDHGAALRSGDEKMQGDQSQPGSRTQLRDPSTHAIETTE